MSKYTLKLNRSYSENYLEYIRILMENFSKTFNIKNAVIQNIRYLDDGILRNLEVDLEFDSRYLVNFKSYFEYSFPIDATISSRVKTHTFSKNSVVEILFFDEYNLKIDKIDILYKKITKELFKYISTANLSYNEDLLVIRIELLSLSVTMPEISQMIKDTGLLGKCRIQINDSGLKISDILSNSLGILLSKKNINQKMLKKLNNIPNLSREYINLISKLKMENISEYLIRYRDEFYKLMPLEDSFKSKKNWNNTIKEGIQKGKIKIENVEKINELNLMPICVERGIYFNKSLFINLEKGINKYGEIVIYNLKDNLLIITEETFEDILMDTIDFYSIF